jgi:hypothetical protein
LAGGGVLGGGGISGGSIDIVEAGSPSHAVLVASARSQYPKKAGKIEQHHITPRYLGGLINGPTVPLDAAYHQLITNEFRRLYHYGQEPPDVERLQRILQQVYDKYPLPPGY